MGETVLIVLMILVLIVGLWNLVQKPKNADNLAVLAEKVQRIESNQDTISRSLGDVRNDLTVTGTKTQGLVETTNQMHSYLVEAKEKLGTLQTLATTRQEEERVVREAVKHLEAVITGTHSKGAAGENILDIVFSKLPIEWQIRDFTVEGKVCEFGLRMPNKRVLPIDSKWTATHLLEQFLACEEISSKQKIKAQIEKAVLQKAQEIQKYLDPEQTVGFGVAVVPDAVYDLCGATMCQVFDLKVAIISHSMFIPYLLLVFQTNLKTSKDVDMQKLDRAISEVEKSIGALQQEIDGRFSRAITMLTNGREDMKKDTSNSASWLNSIHVSSGIPAKTFAFADAELLAAASNGSSVACD